MVERFGKFSHVLQPGLQLLVPIVDKITYVHSLKEEAHSITQQSAITHDNVTIAIDGILYLRVVDPVKASCAAPLSNFPALLCTAVTLVEVRGG